MPETDDARDWEKISPLLNGAIAGLGQSDRDAVVLRFFQNKSHAEIGGVLGVSEDAAKTRLWRALKRLRAKLNGSGIVMNASALAGTLAKHALIKAPAIAGVGGGILNPSLEVKIIAEGAVRTMKLIKLKLAGIVTAALVGPAERAYGRLSAAARR